MAATQLGVPAEILDVVDLMPTFTAENTREALQGSGITVPEFASYAPKLWQYWAEHLDPDRARRDDPAGPLVGKHVIITGASSGIGRASAIAVAERGRDGIRVGAQRRSARRPDRRDPRGRRRCARVHLRRHRRHVGGAHRQGHPRPVRPRRLSRQQRGTIDPPVGDRVDRPAARLRTGDGGQLLRRRPDGARAAAALARTPVRSRRQRVERRGPGPQSEVQLVPAHQGGARRLLRRGVDGDAVRPHHVHQHPHAVGEHADDRAVTAAQPDAPDLAPNTPRRWWCAA